MERKVGETFMCRGTTFVVAEGDNETCTGCCLKEEDCRLYNVGYCSSIYRSDGKNVIFKKSNNMETRTIKLTLEKAKEFYKKGGEFKDLALSAYTEEELTKAELPKTWEEFCNNYKVQKEECFIVSNSVIVNVSSSDTRLICLDRNLLPNKQAAEAHLALMQLHQLRDCYRQGWKPNWDDRNEERYSIIHYNTGQYVVTNTVLSCFLMFQSTETAQLFLDNFRALIEKAGDLI